MEYLCTFWKIPQNELNTADLKLEFTAQWLTENVSNLSISVITETFRLKRWRLVGSSNDSIARRANTCRILKQICGAYIKIRMKLTFYDWRHQPCRQETTVVIKPRLRRALNSPSITVVKCKPKRLPGAEVFIEVHASNGRRTKPKQNKGDQWRKTEMWA